MEIGTITAILGALGAGAILAKLVEGIIQWATGKQDREQNAWEQRDREARARRMLEEYAAHLRLELIESGRTPPPWPEYTTKN